MKKYSDIFSSYKMAINKVGRRIATTAFFMVAAITMLFAQEPYTFVEGSVHKFKVENNPLNTFTWSMYVNPYINDAMDPSSYDLMDGGHNADLTIRFNDMGRTDAELVYLVVEEKNPVGCSTKRALQIKLEPNNMYLEFASATTQDCYTLGDYHAPLKVGINFKDKLAGVQIPENLFPLKVIYQIRNVTDNGPAIIGNKGEALVMDYSAANDYTLLVTEAVGTLTQTTEYELTITSVTDKYDTEITKNSGDIRLQIRIINHLPQSGSMDMALAYVLTPIQMVN